LPWIYGFIFGFHRLARCPKCTPFSSSASTLMDAKGPLL